MQDLVARLQQLAGPEAASLAKQVDDQHRAWLVAPPKCVDKLLPARLADVSVGTELFLAPSAQLALQSPLRCVETPTSGRPTYVAVVDAAGRSDVVALRDLLLVRLQAENTQKSDH